VTGSGKTFTMAGVIARLGRPAIVFAPNKTLAAQLYSEFREFFPKNAVEYFVSYYDYYQPEAYVPQRDLFIEKDSAINEHIEQMRLSATKSVLERRDTIIVGTVFRSRRPPTTPPASPRPGAWSSRSSWPTDPCSKAPCTSNCRPIASVCSTFSIWRRRSSRSYRPTRCACSTEVTSGP
jgi:hypothetical protein